MSPAVKRESSVAVRNVWIRLVRDLVKLGMPQLVPVRVLVEKMKPAVITSVFLHSVRDVTVLTRLRVVVRLVRTGIVVWKGSIVVQPARLRPTV